MLVFVILPAACSHLEVHPVNNKTLFYKESASMRHGLGTAPSDGLSKPLLSQQLHRFPNWGSCPFDHRGGQLPAGVGAERGHRNIPAA